jgi:hypothetical protein
VVKKKTYEHPESFLGMTTIYLPPGLSRYHHVRSVNKDSTTYPLDCHTPYGKETCTCGKYDLVWEGYEEQLVDE